MTGWQIALLVVGIIVILIICMLLFSYYFAYKLTYAFLSPKFKTREEKMAANKQNPTISNYYSLKRIEFTHILSDGYIIHGDYTISNPLKWVICFHGHSSSREGVVKQANIFHNLGFSVLLYDHRFHGDNDHNGHPTMGYQESIDANEMVDFLRNKFGNTIKIGIFGASMGSGTASLLLGKRQDFIFYISDSGYYSATTVFKNQIKKKHVSWLPILKFANNLVYKSFNLHFDNIVPGKCLENNHVPILILHGSKDDLIPVENAKMLYDSNGGEKEIFIFEKGTHTRLYELDYDKYREVVNNFIKKYDK